MPVKIHNAFMVALGGENARYPMISHSLERCTYHILGNMAVSIASLNDEELQTVKGNVCQEQYDSITKLLDAYRNVKGVTCESFEEEKLFKDSGFWNFICRSERGYQIVLDECLKTVGCKAKMLARMW